MSFIASPYTLSNVCRLPALFHKSNVICIVQGSAAPSAVLTPSVFESVLEVAAFLYVNGALLSGTNQQHAMNYTVKILHPSVGKWLVAWKAL